MDMVGNVWEWTSTEQNGPYLRQIRGGSYKSFSNLTAGITQIDWVTVDERRDDVGFRCVMNL
jgi:formylglycine-generating enzyme required for sulfatase activity